MKMPTPHTQQVEEYSGISDSWGSKLNELL
jgi:hypothetical protein